MHTIRLGANRCPTGWKTYDEQIRLRMANNPTNSWANIDSELWLINMHTGANNSNSPSGSGIYKCYDYNYTGSCVKTACPYSHSCLRSTCCNILYTSDSKYIWGCSKCPQQISGI